MFDRKLLVTGLAVVGAFALGATGFRGQDVGVTMEMDEAALEQMEKWMEYAAIGDAHEQLKRRVGTWTCDVKMWMAPDAEAIESSADAEMTMIMGGRFVVEKINGQMMGQPYEGLGITGYDNGLEKFIGSWIDNTGTGMHRSLGTASEDGNTYEYMMEGFDPVTGTMKTVRGVEEFKDADTIVGAMYEMTDEGEERKTFEITYHRK